MTSGSVDRFAPKFLDFFAPRRCFACRSRIASGFSCRQCRERLPWLEIHQVEAWAAFRYQPPVSAQILQLKFHGRLQAAPLLASLVAERLARRASPMPELLVPVPLHPRRVRVRGYNQALEIARPLCRQLGIALAAQAARRVHATAEQTRLSAAQRRRNVRGVFRVEESVRGRHVALLDDVITTGATLEELARSARDAGAARVEAWAVARA